MMTLMTVQTMTHFLLVSGSFIQAISMVMSGINAATTLGKKNGNAVRNASPCKPSYFSAGSDKNPKEEQQQYN